MKNWLLLLMLAITFSCNEKIDSSLVCNVNNTTEDLAWLKAEIQSREQDKSDLSKYFFIEQGEYNNQTVFLYNNCCPMCNTFIPVYDCAGTKLFNLSPGIEIRNTKIIWKPADFACLLM